MYRRHAGRSDTITTSDDPFRIASKKSRVTPLLASTGTNGPYGARTSSPRMLARKLHSGVLVASADDGAVQFDGHESLLVGAVRSAVSVLRVHAEIRHVRNRTRSTACVAVTAAATLPTMLDAPDDLTAGQVAGYVRQHWGLDVLEATYLPLGHGSYNWKVRDTAGRAWFGKADRAGPDSAFYVSTNQTAAALHDHGLDFVNAPIPDLAGDVRPRVSPDWDLGLFPFIVGRNPVFHGPERVLIAEAVGRLHACTDIPSVALRWAPGYRQPELRDLLANDLGRPWTSGPYGEPSRHLLLSNLSGIERLLTYHDRLVDRVLNDPEPWVITHGEPHGGNTMLDTDGRIHLIDCNASMVAPRERDMRLLLHGGHRVSLGLDNTEVLAGYRRAAGQADPRPYILEMYRAEWHLMEISLYAQQFRDPHDDGADPRGHWRTLREYVPVEPNWPELPAESSSSDRAQ